MSDWLDYFEFNVSCPYCNYNFPALFEKDDPKIAQKIVISLAHSPVQCPSCKANIEDSDITTLY